MSRPVRTAAIVGTHWGLVHLPALRSLGIEVTALVSRDRADVEAVAAREGVPRGTDRLADIHDVDLVVVATPAATHLSVIRGLSDDQWIVCEKPLVGVGQPPAAPSGLTGRMFVNYAFAYLRAARVAEQALTAGGPVSLASLECSVNLPLDFDTSQWTLEVAAHPLSWIYHLFGEPTHVRDRLTGPHRRLSGQAGRTPFVMDFRVGGPSGIHQSVRLTTPEGDVVVSGSYVPGSTWQYRPVTLAGTGVGETVEEPGDPWLAANARSVADIVAVYRGQMSAEQGISRGLFDPVKALWLERSLQSTGWGT